MKRGYDEYKEFAELLSSCPTLRGKVEAFDDGVGGLVGPILRLNGSHRDALVGFWRIDCALYEMEANKRPKFWAGVKYDDYKFFLNLVAHVHLIGVPVTADLIEAARQRDQERSTERRVPRPLRFRRRNRVSKGST